VNKGIVIETLCPGAMPACGLIEPEGRIPPIVQSVGFAVWNLADRLDPDIRRAQAGFKLGEDILV
jgi:hypothetical protein